MKTIGIVGGIGPESTLDYYRGIIDACKPDYAREGYPEILISSMNLKQLVAQAECGDWNGIARDIAARFEHLRAGGAVFGAIASNTPHRVFDAIQAATALPLISIVSETARSITDRNLTRICLLGTGFTMRSAYYQQELSRYGIETAVPAEDEISWIQEKLFTEIELGIIRDDTRSGLVTIMRRIAEEHGTQGVILGCTELPLILRPEDVPGAYINTTRIHIDAIVRESRT